MIGLIKFISWLRNIIPLQGRGIMGEGLMYKKTNPLSKLFLFANAQRQFLSLPWRETYKPDTKYLF